MCVKTDILTTLAYFDLFRYPLTQTEIFFFLPDYCEQENFTRALYALVQEDLVFKLDDFFSLQEDASLAGRRRKGNLAAKKMLDTADGIAAFLSSFPFVRGVAVSGSLSKNFADERSDIDFFIITQKDRLWLARTLMHLFKKCTFLLGKQHFFCMNYYVDEAGLQIKEKNTFTATELATLLPMRGITAFQDFYKQNAWSRELLPNYSMKIAYTKDVRNSFVKQLLESCLNHPLGTALDYLLMKITARRWAKKSAQNRLNANGNRMGLDVSRHYAKPDPGSFQRTFLDNYKRRVHAVLEQYRTQLKTVS